MSKECASIGILKSHQDPFFKWLIKQGFYHPPKAFPRPFFDAILRGEYVRKSKYPVTRSALGKKGDFSTVEVSKDTYRQLRRKFPEYLTWSHFVEDVLAGNWVKKSS